jgi:DNA-binding beta-propeller fold protein YncE
MDLRAEVLGVRLGGERERSDGARRGRRAWTGRVPVMAFRAALDAVVWRSWLLGVAVLVLMLAVLVSAAHAAGSAYVTNYGGRNVSEFDVGAGGVLTPMTPASVSAGSGPAGIAVSPNGQNVYVTDYVGDDVSQFTVGAGGVLTPMTPATVAAGTGPHAVAVSPDGQNVYVTDYVGDDVSQFTVGAGGVLTPMTPATVAAGTGPQAVAVSPDGLSVYVTDHAGGVSEFTVGAGGVLTLMTPGVSTGTNPQGIAVSPSGRGVYVANYGGGVSEFDVGAGGVLTPMTPASVSAGTNPQAIAVSPSGRGVYVANYGGGVSEFDVGAGGVLTPMTPASVSAGTNPVGIAVSPAGSSVYVTNTGEGVSEFDVGAGGVLTPMTPANVSAGASPAGIALLPDQGPVAVLAATPAAAGDPTTLDASGSSTSDGGPATYSWSFGDGSSATTSTPITTHVYPAAASYNVTVTVTDDEGCSTNFVFTGQTAYCNGRPAASKTVAVTVPLFATSPVITSVTQSASKWRENNTLAHISAKKKNKKKPPVGTTFSFSLNEPARVTLAFTQSVGGRKVGKKCVAQTKKNKKKHSCTRTSVAGALTFSAHAGRNHVRFAGPLTAQKKLKTGVYTLVITASASGKHSTPKTLHFMIVKG